MARVESPEIANQIISVLAQASTGKGTEHGFLTAYQILNRMPEDIQQILRQQYGNSGKHGGQPFGAASRISQVADELQEVEKRYLDTGGLQFDVGQPDDVEAGYNLCAIFRIP